MRYLTHTDTFTVIAEISNWSIWMMNIMQSLHSNVISQTPEELTSWSNINSPDKCFPSILMCSCVPLYDQTLNHIYNVVCIANRGITSTLYACTNTCNKCIRSTLWFMFMFLSYHKIHLHLLISRPTLDIPNMAFANSFFFSFKR